MITITNEDCMDLMERYPDNHFEIAIVDPPYGIGANREKEHNGWNDYGIKDWDLERPGADYFNELIRVSENQIICGGNYFVENLLPSMGWVFWDKGQRSFSCSDGELIYTSFSRAIRVFAYSRAKLSTERGVHPTQKPVALYKWLLKNYAKPGDKILDTHLGSGSIAIACHDAGFDLTACEIDKDYYEAAMKRLEQHQRQLKLFELNT